MDVTRSWGFGAGRKRKPRDELAAAAKRREGAERRAKRRAKNAKRGVCYCDEYPYPHRPGSHGAPSSASAKQREHGAARSGSAMRGRLKRLVGWAKKRDARRWGWGGSDAAPF